MKISLLRITGAITGCLTKHQYKGLDINPFILKILLVILLSVYHTVFYDGNLEKLVLGQLIIHLNYIFPILISCLFDIVLKS